MTFKPLSGIYSALVTPFGPEEELDLDGVRSLVEDQVAAGVAGVVVNGSTGEFPAMTFDERRQVAETAAASLAGRADLVVGLGSMRTRDSQDLAEHARALGARCGLLVMPYYEPPTSESLERFVGDVASIGLPIMLYNNPGGTGSSMSPEFIARLGRIENVVAIKDTTPEPWRLFEIDRLAEGSLDVLSGHDSSTIYTFLAGRQAAVWGAPNVHPRACVALWKLAAVNGDRERAVALWRALYPIQAFLESHDYAASTKAGASLRGVAVGNPRLPVLPLADSEVSELAQRIAVVDETLVELGLA